MGLPGITMGFCHLPFTLLTTNVPSRPAAVPTPLLVPAALQLPGEAHASAETSTSPSPVTGSVMTLCQIPLTSLTTNGLAPFGTHVSPARAAITWPCARH